MPKLREILDTLVDEEIRKRGFKYFLDGRVNSFYFIGNMASATVSGKTDYYVKIRFDNQKIPSECLCTCPYFEVNICKHVVAVLYRINKLDFFTSHYPIRYYKDSDVNEGDILPDDFEQDEISGFANISSLSHSPIKKLNYPQENLKEQKQKWIEEIEKKKEAVKFTRFNYSISGLVSKNGQGKISKKSSEITYKTVYGIEAKGYSTGLYVLKQRLKKDGTVGAIEEVHEPNFINLNVTSLQEKLIIELIARRYGGFSIDVFDSDSIEGYQKGERKDQQIFMDVFDFLKDKEVYLYQHFNVTNKRIFIEEETGNAELMVTEKGKDIQLKLNLFFKEQKIRTDAHIIPLLGEPLWVLVDDRVFKIKNLTYSQLKVFENNNNNITVPAEYVDYFEENYIPKIIKNLPLNSPLYKVEDIKTVPGKRIYLDEISENGKAQILITLKFGYGDYELNYNELQKYYSYIKDKHVYRIERDNKAEKEAKAQIKSFYVKEVEEGKFSPRNKPLDFLFNFIPELKAMGFEIYGESKLTKYRINYTKPKYNVIVTSGIDWFDVKIEFDYGGTTISLKTLLEALKQKKRYIQLDDGSVGLLPEEWLQKFQRASALSQVVKDNNSPEGDSNLRYLPSQAKTIDDLFSEAEALQKDDKFNEYVEKLNSFENIKTQIIPSTFNNVLRPYQESGYNWFYFLKEYNFGGILADDMGLGKTIQVLTLLTNEKMLNPGKPSLVVAPTSVVFNWINEAAKFLPPPENGGLKLLNHSGKERSADDKIFGEYDVIVTSYAILLRDSEFFLKQEFNYLIFDESQKVKNPLSQSAKIARALNSAHKLCLTGTPVENNLDELWSQFSIINPGMLGSLNKFQEAFARPIQKYGDVPASDHLRKIIFPFVLRRTKDIVAKELPPKTEITHYCEMEPEQEKIYNTWRDSIREDILKTINEVGIKRSGFKVIEGLLRLRQICNHPVLVKDTYKKKSGKFEEFKEQLDKVVEEGHKVLVFSQFVKMLEIISKDLKSKKIKFEYLTGSTKDRESCVNNFQNNEEVKVFLISLKAGGFGLNLTAADYVFHYDPWWNPAVEMQATDRTHRIGQDKNVFVYKFITKDSVEEKILNLQEKKKELIKNIISGEKGILKNLTKEDIEVLFSPAPLS